MSVKAHAKDMLFGKEVFVFFFKMILFVYLFFILISHPFYTHQCIHVNPNRPIHHTTAHTPPPLSPLGVHTSLHLCLNFCPANQFICTIFLRSTYMR